MFNIETRTRTITEEIVTIPIDGKIYSALKEDVIECLTELKNNEWTYYTPVVFDNDAVKSMLLALNLINQNNKGSYTGVAGSDEIAAKYLEILNNV